MYERELRLVSQAMRRAELARELEGTVISVSSDDEGSIKSEPLE